MQRIALFPGSFDPITLGHEDILRRAMPLFDKIIIAVGENANKAYMFSLQQRMDWIKEVFRDSNKIEVTHYQGLTVDFAKKAGANFLLRGIRNPADFEFEKSIAQANRQMVPELETIFLLTSARLAYISSSIVRDVIRHNGDHTLFVPSAVKL
ncbi:MAG: pantetheine-phosphate adenylyltransferase [Bacteroidota bacterium]|nr:pantetheine-phosphate adenylyltransferase [Bacteroidota bacterium]MDX5506674.1 pantetheine-phosphate adenylyltransferase [Bacteroidota bacterium]